MDIVNSGIYIEDEKLGTYALSAAKLLPVEGEYTVESKEKSSALPKG